MKFDFDRVIDRRGTYSVKYDPAARGLPDDVLPLWVADLDFQAPPCVSAALEARARHGVFGYSKPDSAYFDTVRAWFEQRFGWSTEREWLIMTPGVVNSIYIAIRALTAPGDGVVIQQPVYHPFGYAIRDTGRRALINELRYNDGRYSVDFDDFEEKAKQAGLFILCSPHNPVGRVWTREELGRMGEICLRHGVTIISDEIHQDFVYPGSRHFALASLDKRLADVTVTCTAPSKTFNLAGLQLSNTFISNEGMRGRFLREYESCGLGHPGVMGMISCKAAYESGAEWLQELLVYLSGNFSLVREFLRERIPKVKLVEPEGTYLAWLDFSGLGLSAQELDDLIIHKARLWLNSGTIFGLGGVGFQRMNTGCPRSVLSEGLKRLEAAFGSACETG
jgi:cystathionine beta-lyase